ncbi:MAG: hypothetical protein ACR2PP_04190, partial [Psychrobacter sp.]
MFYSSLPLSSKLFKFTALSLALFLAGCGGGDGGGDTLAPEFNPDDQSDSEDNSVGGNQNPEDPSTSASEIFISTDKTQLLTGTDKTTVNIRVTDKNGGIVAGVPVIINIADSRSYGLSLNTVSEQVTDDNGLITFELVQSTVGVDSQLDHESLLTVSLKNNESIEQTIPIIVSGTTATNVISTSNAIDAGENFSISGQIVDGGLQPVANADLVLYSNDNQVSVGRSDSSGNFVFDLNASNLEAVNDNFLFSIGVKGAQIVQRIPDILTVVSTNSSSISFSQTPDIIIGNKQKVTLNAPEASNGDIVYVSTNKGEILASESENQGSSRRGLQVDNNKIE